MRGQSHILQISNGLQELKRLREHLEPSQLVDLGANLEALAKTLVCDSKTSPGLCDSIRAEFKASLLPANINNLLTSPAELRGGMFKAVLTAQNRVVFAQKDFQKVHPDLFAEFSNTQVVPFFSYKPRG